MTDEPDFSPRRGVDILSQSVGNLAVELAAETIGSLGVDIVSQSVGDLDININGQTGNLNVNLDGSNVTLDVNLDGQTVTLDTNITGSSTTLDTNIDSQTATLDTSVSSSTATFDTNITGQSVNLSTVLEAANTVLDTNIDSQSTTLDTNIDSQTSEVGIDIQSQTISDLGIDIQSQSLSQVGTRQDQEPSETINFVQITRDTTVDDVGTGDSVFFSPPSDEVWELQAIRLEANPVPGASSGTHGWSVFALDGQIGLATGISDFASDVTWNDGYWETATDTKNPPSVSAQGQAVKGVRVGQNTPLEIQYFNNTDTSTGETRTIRALFRAVKVA